jgi:hypothetical protein
VKLEALNAKRQAAALRKAGLERVTRTPLVGHALEEGLASETVRVTASVDRHGWVAEMALVKTKQGVLSPVVYRAAPERTVRLVSCGARACGRGTGVPMNTESVEGGLRLKPGETWRAKPRVILYRHNTVSVEYARARRCDGIPSRGGRPPNETRGGQNAADF